MIFFTSGSTGKPKGVTHSFETLGWVIAGTAQSFGFTAGDVMKADEGGYLWFCGRKKQIIVHDASNISPQEVEGALVEHPAISGAGVVGVRDLVHGENVWAYVAFLVEGAARPTAQQMTEFARARVGYKAPEVIEVLDELPLNAPGKVDRVRLGEMAERQAQSGVRT